MRDASNFKNQPPDTFFIFHIQKKVEKTWWKLVNSHISRGDSSGWWANCSLPKTILSAIKFPIIMVISIFSVTIIFLEIFSKNLSVTPSLDQLWVSWLISWEPLICIYSAGQGSIEYVSSFPKQPYSSKSVENWQAQPASKLTNFPGHFLGRLKDSRHFVSPKKKLFYKRSTLNHTFQKKKSFLEKVHSYSRYLTF